MVDKIAAAPVPTLQPDASLSSAAPAAISTLVAKPSHLSPSLELHPDIGIVVIQFWSQQGTVELSIPSQKQLDAYAADPFAAFKTPSLATA